MTAVVLQPADCEFLNQAQRNYVMFTLTASLFALTIVLRPVFSKVCAKLDLNEAAKKAGETRESLPLRTTLNFVGFWFHIFLGPFAAYHSFLHIREDSAVSLTAASSIVSPSACSFCWHSGLAGTIFAAYTFWQLLQMIPFIGWELINAENMVHHFCFTFLAMIHCNSYFGAEIVCMGVAMEVSTPPLLALLTFRQLHGYEKAAANCKAVFAVLFIFFRVGLFGLAVFHFVGLWFFNPEVVKKFVLTYVPPYVFFGILPLWVIGWSLQAWWAVTLSMNACRKGTSKEEDEGLCCDEEEGEDDEEEDEEEEEEEQEEDDELREKRAAKVALLA